MNCPLCNRSLIKHVKDNNVIEYDCYTHSERNDNSVNYEYMISILNDKIIDYCIILHLNGKEYHLQTDSIENEGYDNTSLFEIYKGPDKLLISIDYKIMLDFDNPIKSAKNIIKKLLKLIHVQ